MIKLIDSLLEKGIKERKLKYNLKKTFEKRMSFVEKEEIPIEYECYDDLLDIKNCYLIIEKIEEKFSDYLNFYEKEWACKEIRNKWVHEFNFSENIYQIVTILKIL
jgi:hypothetical protein